MTRSRQIRGLQKVSLEPSGPFPRPRLKGRAAEGLRYQNNAISFLSQVFNGYGPLYPEQWFRYTDTYGSHWGQIDLGIELPSKVIVCEMKLSLRREDEARNQLSKLYRPAMEAFFSKPVAMLVVFKHWLGESGLSILPDPLDLVPKSSSSLREVYGYHCLL